MSASPAASHPATSPPLDGRYTLVTWGDGGIGHISTIETVPRERFRTMPTRGWTRDGARRQVPSSGPATVGRLTARGTILYPSGRDVRLAT